MDNRQWSEDPRVVWTDNSSGRVINIGGSQPGPGRVKIFEKNIQRSGTASALHQLLGRGVQEDDLSQILQSGTNRSTCRFTTWSHSHVKPKDGEGRGLQSSVDGDNNISPDNNSPSSRGSTPQRYSRDSEDVSVGRRICVSVRKNMAGRIVSRCWWTAFRFAWSQQVFVNSLFKN